MLDVDHHIEALSYHLHRGVETLDVVFEARQHPHELLDNLIRIGRVYLPFLSDLLFILEKLHVVLNQTSSELFKCPLSASKYLLYFQDSLLKHLAVLKSSVIEYFLELKYPIIHLRAAIIGP